MLAGHLPALEVEHFAVAVVGRISKDGHMAVVLNPAHLPVVGDVAPDQEFPNGVPCRTLRPQRPGPQTLNRCVRLCEAIEGRIDREDVRIPEIDVQRSIRAEIPRRVGHRGHVWPLLLAQRGPRSQRDRTRAKACKESAAARAGLSVALLRFAGIEELLLSCSIHSMSSSLLNTERGGMTIT